MMKYVKTIQRQLNSTLVDSLADIGLSQGLDLKRSGTELTITNQVDLGTERQRECYWIHRNRASGIPWHHAHACHWRPAGQCGKSVRFGLNTFIALDLPIIPILLFNEVWLQERKNQGGQIVFFTSVDPMNEPQRDELYNVKRGTRGTLSNEMQSGPECSLLDPSEKCSRWRIYFLANTFRCYCRWQLCTSRLSGKGGNSQNQRFFSNDSCIATSATDGYSPKC